jgi:hypothetical protein
LHCQHLLKPQYHIITPQAIDRFEIERSINNTTYTKVGQLSTLVQLNMQQSFSYTDDITNVASNIIYCRLKVIAANGEVKYSNVLVVRKSTTKIPIIIMPNPATDYVQVRLYSDKQTDVIIRLMDETGKLVLTQYQKVQKVNNTLQINNLIKFAKGNYMLLLTKDDEVFTHKIMLIR